MRRLFLTRARRRNRSTGSLCVALAALLSAGSFITASRAEAAGARYLGSMAANPSTYPAAAIESTNSGDGYWIVTSRGQVYSFGDAHFYGGLGQRTIGTTIVDIVATPSGNGYLLIGRNGAVFPFGDASWHGSMKGRTSSPIVAAATTPTGNGYWLFSRRGRVFHFGDARWRGAAFGSTSTTIEGAVATPTGRGYWLAGANGAVFRFGDAGAYGSMAGRGTYGDVVDIAATSTGRGYWLVTANGSIYNFGDAKFRGSMGRQLLLSPVVSITAPPDGGYWFASAEGAVYTASADGTFTADPYALSTKISKMTSDLYYRINLERNARGLTPLEWDPVLSDLARYWANYMGNTGQFRHQDLGALFRDPKFATRYRSLRENIYNGTGSWRTAGAAHLSLMTSDPHRATILTPELTSVGVGVACLNGRLWVVQEFGVWLNRPAPAPRATPSRDPIVASSTAGLSC